MEYYQSTPPPLDNSGLSGAIGFKFGDIIATNQIKPSSVAFNYPAASPSSSSPQLKIYTIDICVDNMSKKLDVYVAGDPY